METVSNPSEIKDLKAAWAALEAARPGIRIREAAKELHVGEAQLLATTVGQYCIRLEASWPEFLKRLPELGHVMSLTRNNGCILEHKGNFQKVNTFGEGNTGMATVIGPIETRVFFKNWHVAFAVQQEKSDRELLSLQVFDKAGDAVTKIYLQEKSHEDAYWKLIEDFRSPNQSTEQEAVAYEEAGYGENIDQTAFLADWEALKDTHDFFPMLTKHQAHRYQALELAAGKFAYQVPVNDIQTILETAAETKLPIMIFAGNRGNLQIHQGKVRTIRMLERGHGGAAERWLNILDPDFNMHLRMDVVDTMWVVNKPTEDGMVTSLELFDADKNLLTQVFGLRKPGIPQKEEWTKLVGALPKF